MALYLSLIFVFLACAATPKSLDQVSITPTPLPDSKKYKVLSDTVVFEDNNVFISVRHLSPALLNRYYQERNLPNPFINFPQGKEFTIFAVKFINNSKDRITYNPMMSAMFEGNEKPIRPIDVTDFYFMLSSEPDGEMRMQIIKKTAYDIQFILKTGEEKNALLIFPAIDLSTKAVILIMRDIYFGYKWVNLPFAFDVTANIPPK